MDAKTLLLLGIGMAVLSLVGFCAARARSAELVFCQRPLPSGFDVTQPEVMARCLPGANGHLPVPMAASGSRPTFG